MASDTPVLLARATRASLIAPAGFGKTDVIARAVAQHAESPQLVLTHTHAGVRALRERLARYGASPSSFHLDTIAGFALRYAASFPRTSNIDTTQPMGDQWVETYGAATRVLSTRFGARVVANSFKGVFVDEYQDCTPSQHALILQLAEIVPTRLVGDPLQGIFEFGGGVVDWETDVFPAFARLDDLEEPWRWRFTNPDLGDWLVELRKNLLSGIKTSLSAAPIRWKSSTHPAEQLAQCKALGETAGSVVAIRKWPHQCHPLAGRLGGVFTSMEEVESRDLQTYAKKLQEATGAKRVEVLFEFTSKCMTAVSPDFGSMRKTVASGGKPKVPSTGKKRAVVENVIALVNDDELIRVVPAMKAIERASTGNLYRGELWAEMQQAIALFSSEPEHETLAKAAWVVRDLGRHHGRKMAPKVVSRTLLVKGLEFDHSIVLDASELETKDLYVAMTRGSSSLTVLSESSTV